MRIKRNDFWMPDQHYIVILLCRELAQRAFREDRNRSFGYVILAQNPLNSADKPR
jgi:hypothetical protein